MDQFEGFLAEATKQYDIGGRFLEDRMGAFESAANAAIAARISGAIGTDQATGSGGGDPWSGYAGAAEGAAAQQSTRPGAGDGFGRDEIGMGGRAYGNGMMGVCSRRNLDIEKMTKDMEREECILWRGSACTLLEMNEHLSGHAPILEMVLK